MFTPDDIAVMHAQGASPPGASSASFARAGSIQVGDIVLAIGTP